MREEFENAQSNGLAWEGNAEKLFASAQSNGGNEYFAICTKYQ